MKDELRELALNAHRNGDLKKAEVHYRELLAISSKPEDAVNLGALLRGQGRLREAGILYEKHLQISPYHKQMLLNAANCFNELKDYNKCLRAIEVYLEKNPLDNKVLCAYAKVLNEVGRSSKGEGILRELLKAEPKSVDIMLELGLCLYKQNKTHDALNYFEQATLLDPNNIAAASNRIVMMKDAGDFGKCKEYISTLTEELENSDMVLSAIAGLYMKEMDMEMASKILFKQCILAPKIVANWLNLSACLRYLKHCNAALKVLKKGLCWHPNEKDLEQAFGQCLAELGNTEKAIPVLLKSINATDRLKSNYLFNLQFLGSAYHLIKGRILKEWALEWEEHVKAKDGIGPLWLDRIREPIEGRRLKIGYLSADWCNHPVGRFMISILREHNKEKHEIWGICSTPHHDEMHDKLRKLCEHWVDIRHASELETARVIADLNLDVVIELGGYTGHSRLEALIHRAAPVQLSYLGYFAPCYLKAIDGWIGDKQLFNKLDKVDMGAQKLWTIKGGYMAYGWEGQLPNIERCESKIFRFGNFNHSRKLNKESIRLYAETLKKVPNSQLVLKSISFVEKEERDRIKKALIQAGIEKERIIILNATEKALEHMLLYKNIDVVLDPIPYGGATSTCDALIMGVPVISLAGNGMVGNLSSSILASAGLNQWIANTKTEYTELAIRLAQKGSREVKKRQALREKVLRSPLCDAKRLANELEKIYEVASRDVIST